jgi:hypothetical protein
VKTTCWNLIRSVEGYRFGRLFRCIRVVIVGLSHIGHHQLSYDYPRLLIDARMWHNFAVFRMMLAEDIDVYRISFDACLSIVFRSRDCNRCRDILIAVYLVVAFAWMAIAFIDSASCSRSLLQLKHQHSVCIAFVIPRVRAWVRVWVRELVVCVRMSIRVNI